MYCYCSVFLYGCCTHIDREGIMLTLALGLNGEAILCCIPERLQSSFAIQFLNSPPPSLTRTDGEPHLKEIGIWLFLVCGGLVVL